MSATQRVTSNHHILFTQGFLQCVNPLLLVGCESTFSNWSHALFSTYHIQVMMNVRSQQIMKWTGLLLSMHVPCQSEYSDSLCAETIMMVCFIPAPNWFSLESMTNTVLVHVLHVGKHAQCLSGDCLLDRILGIDIGHRVTVQRHTSDRWQHSWFLLFLWLQRSSNWWQCASSPFDIWKCHVFHVS